MFHWFLLFDSSNLVFFDFAEPPQFIQKLPPATFVKLCEGHRFECKATSARSLKMCWYKNDQKITEGNNYKVVFVDSTAYLQLRTTRFEDNGVYTCEAQNDAGSVSCSTVLTVQGQLLKLHMDVCGFWWHENERFKPDTDFFQCLVSYFYECFWNQTHLSMQHSSTNLCFRYFVFRYFRVSVSMTLFFKCYGHSDLMTPRPKA